MTPAELAERFYLRSVALLARHELLRITNIQLAVKAFLLRVSLDPKWRPRP